MSPALAPSIEVHSLTYTYPDHTTGVTNVSLFLPPRSRTLLIGANGAGKTTLLRLLAGKHLPPRGAIRVGGLDPFADGVEGVVYLGLEWILTPQVRIDIGVSELLRSVGGDVFGARRDELIDVLDVDAAWRMHTISDGERRRVQLCMGLVRPWTVLLVDEITADLDVWTRARFLAWLVCETEARDCTIVYATHILDHLAGWPTHLVHMHLGAVKEWGRAEEVVREAEEASSRNSLLGELVLHWLAADSRERGPRRHNRITSEARTYHEGAMGAYGLDRRPGHDGRAPAGGSD